MSKILRRIVSHSFDNISTVHLIWRSGRSKDADNPKEAVVKLTYDQQLITSPHQGLLKIKRLINPHCQWIGLPSEGITSLSIFDDKVKRR